MKLRTWTLFVFLLLLVSAPFAQGYAPWGGTGLNTPSYAGGGQAQGIPTGGTYVPQTFGTATAWQATQSVPQHAVYVPSGVAQAHTGFWYQPLTACTTGTTEPQWPASFAATVLDTSGGGTCTWQAQGTEQPVPGGWVTALDFDWTQGSASSQSTDGTFSFGGVTWNKVNSAGESTHVTFGGGTGLVFKPVTTAVFLANGTRNAPMVEIAGTSVVPGLQCTTPIRVWAYQATGNQGTSTLNGISGVLSLGYESGNTTWPAAWIQNGFNCGSGGGCGTTVPANYLNNNWNGNRQSTLLTGPSGTGGAATWPQGQAVWMTEFPNGVCSMHYQGYIGAKPSTNSWPNEGNMLLVVSNLSGTNSQGNWAQYENAILNTSQARSPTMSDIQFFMMAETETPSGSIQNNLTFTINRFRVDYHY